MDRANCMDIVAAARDLSRAEADVTGIPPLTQAYSGGTVDDAYRIQRKNIDARRAAGETIIGRKIGLTSVAMQRQLGVDQPDYGAITDALEVANGAALDPGIFVKPRLEAEFSFRLGSDLAL